MSADPYEFTRDRVKLPNDVEQRGEDLMNVQLVGSRAGNVVIVLPRAIMTRREALVHAAWLVAVAETFDRAGEDAGKDFAKILETVRDT